MKNFTGQSPNKSAALILGVLVLIFISPAFFQGRYLAPVDTTHFVAPYLDITTQMLPWWKLSGEIIRSGHLPFWNIYSGQGLPLTANMQSAIFFPLTWLFYLFPLKFALIAYAYLKLWLMGMLTFLFLRELKLKFSPSLLGGILFAFCNALTIWFLWPLTSVILILPLSLFLIERYFNTHDVKTALLLAPVTALGLFAGHPQTFFYVFCAIFGYAVFKSIFSVGTGRDRSLRLLFVSSMFVLGVVMSAITVLPFLEYLKLSANLDYRAGFAENPFYLQPLMFIANFIPDFYSNTGVKNFSYLLVPNYGELALGYIGVSGLLLSLLAFGKKMAKQIWFFAIAALLTLALIYHAPIIYWLINKLPGFSLNYNNRLLYLWAFFLSVLAAYGLEQILDGKISRKRLNWTFGGFAVFAALMVIANRLVTRGWQFAHNLDWHTVSLWQDAVIAAFIVNLAIAYLILKNLAINQCHCEGVQPTEAILSTDKKIASSPVKALAPRNDTGKLWLTALFVLVILETTIHGMIFVKTSRPQNFYPETGAIQYLQKQYQADHLRVFTYGDNLLPNIGTWYGINELNDHDTIYLRSNKKLKAAIGNYNYSPEYTFSEPNLDALRFLSVGYLLYPADQGANMLKYHAPDVTLAYRDNNYVILKLNNPLPRAYAMASKQPVQNFSIVENGEEHFSVNLPAADKIVMTDNYYPGWVAWVDGQNIAIDDFQGLRSINVPAGEHSVTINYEPKSFRLGWEISLGAIIIWLGLFFVIRFVSFRPTPSEPT